MPTIRIDAAQSCVIKALQPTQNFSTGATCRPTMPYQSESEHMLVSFQPPPSNIRKKKITRADVYVYVAPGTGFGQVELSPRYSAFTASTANYANNNEWNRFYRSFLRVWYLEPQYAYTEISADYGNTDAKELLKNGATIGTTSGPNVDTYTSRGTYPPYLVLYYEDASVNLGSFSPSSGYVAKHKAQKFSWRIGTNDLTYDDITQTSATFRWRTAPGATPTETSLTTANSITVPAGTFTTASFQWQVTATADTGETFTSEWMTLSTVEELSTANIIEPVDVVVDGSKEIPLKWQHNISTGTTQTKFDIQTSADGTIFTDFHSASSEAQSYVVPANTFSAGNLFWRVRTYNTDNAAGAWSESAKIAVRAAPPMPSVTVTASPRPVVSWQAIGQQAYEVEFGNVKSGLKFGIERSMVCPEYLTDGTHTAKVKVQNNYGLWSSWGSVDFVVTNTPGNAITLTVNANHAATLTWSTTGNYTHYYVYRDDKLIAKTTDKKYIDNLSAGTVVYRVRGAYSANGNYRLSNAVAVNISCETVMICNISSGEWTMLDKTSTSDRINATSDGLQARYIYFSGSAYPSIELSEFKNKKYVFEAAFNSALEANEFAKLIGKLVCVKDQWGNMVIGVLIGLNKSSGRFYQSFSCEVEQISFNEVVSHD